MYFTSCHISTNDLIKLSLVKFIFLYFVFKYSNKNIHNLLLGWLLLILYSHMSDEKTIYNCNIKNSNMEYTFAISSLIYIMQ